MTLSTRLNHQWQLAEGVSLVWRNWDESYVVLNSSSGDTHQFDANTASIIQYLEHTDAPQTLESIAQYLNLDAEKNQQLYGTLVRLVNYDLVEQIH
jgi:hypothetical protein